MNRPFLILPCVLLLISFLTNVNGGLMQPKSQSSRPALRYAILSDEIVNVTGDPNPANSFRYVEVLIDEKTFSEQTLRELFKLISARFPVPIRLDVAVYTSLEQVDTPEERERGYVSEAPYEPEADNYHRAIFIRSFDYELLRYSVEIPVRGLKTVVLKGMEPGTRQVSETVSAAELKSYSMVSDEIVNVTGDAEDTFRYVVVLLDEKAFSEQRLKELFKLVSARFPTPSRLDVQVYTNLKQVETSEERAHGTVSESPDAPDSDKYHWALFIRSQDSELFRYNPNPPNTTMKTVILKGKDPTIVQK